jgi:hypothetical protein
LIHDHSARGARFRRAGHDEIVPHVLGPQSSGAHAVEDEIDTIETSDCTILELLDRLLHKGVVLGGEVTISVADIELVYLRLQLTLCSVETARRAGWLVPAPGVGEQRGLPHVA